MRSEGYGTFVSTCVCLSVCVCVCVCVSVSLLATTFFLSLHMYAQRSNEISDINRLLALTISFIKKAIFLKLLCSKLWRE